MVFQTGQKRIPGSGRKKGQLNYDVALIRGMVAEALTKSGGVKYLMQQAKDNPSAFMALVGKVLPRDFNAQIESTLTIVWPINPPKIEL
jgi:hypothetical protein